MDDTFGAAADFAGRMGLTGELQTTVNAAVNAGVSAALDVSASAGVSAAASLSISALQNAAGLSAPQPPPGTRPPDLLVPFRFRVEIDAIGTMHFQSCTVPVLQMDAEAIASGGSPKHIFNAPSPAWSWSGDVQLKRGLSPDGGALWRWVEETATKSRIVPHNITITLIQEDGADGIAWTFRDAYPVAWKLDGDMNAAANSPAMEAFTFTHQGADIKFPGGSYQNIGAPEAPPEKPASPSTPPTKGNGTTPGGGSGSKGGSAPGGGAGQKGGATPSGGNSGQKAGASGPSPSGGGTS